MSRDRVDPENLINERPSLVDVDGQGTVYVADARVRESGWLWIREWDGATAKVPPHRVLAVRRVEIETYGEPDPHSGMKSKRIADEDWREEAKQSPDEIGQSAVVADD